MNWRNKIEKIYVLTETDIADIELTIEELRLEFDTSCKQVREYLIEKIKNKGVER